MTMPKAADPTTFDMVGKKAPAFNLPDPTAPGSRLEDDRGRTGSYGIVGLIKMVGVVSLAVFGASCATSRTEPGASASASTSTYSVLPVSEVQWDQLNPARGDQSPQAGALWGNRIGPGAAGFLLKPVDGFRSPPHIHNVAYRGVVISGFLHNDDPGAEDMWMGKGSFWTQPAGEIHITAAKGSDALAYIEVEDFFGVFPPEDAFEVGDKAINVDASNIVWLDSSNVQNVTDGSGVAWLWGRPSAGEMYGALLKLELGFSGSIESDAATFRAVVIQGNLGYSNASLEKTLTLQPGSTFASEGQATHSVRTDSSQESLVYIRTNGSFRTTPSP